MEIHPKHILKTERKINSPPLTFANISFAILHLVDILKQGIFLTSSLALDQHF